jgi:hypothetical protein
MTINKLEKNDNIKKVKKSPNSSSLGLACQIYDLIVISE